VKKFGQTALLVLLIPALGLAILALIGTPAASATARSASPSTATAGHPRRDRGPHLSASPWSSWSAPTTTGTASGLAAVTTSGSGTWIAVGPSGLVVRSTDDGNTWQVVNAGIPSSFNLTAATYSGGTFWIGGDAGTLYASSDGGATWTNETISDANGGPFIKGLVFTSPMIGYLAGTEAAGGVGFVGVIDRTADGGHTWAAVTLPSSPVEQEWDAIAFNSAGVGLATNNNDDNILRTTDGVNWSIVNPSGFVVGQWLNGVAFAPNGTTAVAVGAGNQLLQSTDSGQTWSGPVSPLADSAATFAGVGFVPTSSGLGVAVGQDNGQYQVILDTNDSGSDWATAYAPADASHPYLSGAACSVTTCIAVGDQGSNILRATTGFIGPPTATPIPTLTPAPGVSPRVWLPIAFHS
jgi:photosystem II stability/assembly factor-like uncharacterized protein